MIHPMRCSEHGVQILGLFTMLRKGTCLRAFLGHHYRPVSPSISRSSARDFPCYFSRIALRYIRSRFRWPCSVGSICVKALSHTDRAQEPWTLSGLSRARILRTPSYGNFPSCCLPIWVRSAYGIFMAAAAIPCPRPSSPGHEARCVRKSFRPSSSEFVACAPTRFAMRNKILQITTSEEQCQKGCILLQRFFPLLLLQPLSSSHSLESLALP